MLKRNKKTVILTAIITALPMLMGLLLWQRLPETIATHFDFGGEPNGWSSKAFAVFGLPLILVGAHLLCAFGTMLDPKRRNIQDKMYRLVLWIIPVISILTCGAVYAYALGKAVDITLIAELMVGIVFIVVGNYLPKCRQSYTMGIKIPWTLSDEDNWNATHRFGGKVWIVGGVVFFAMTLLGSQYEGLGEFLTFGVIIAMVALPTVYSYLYYRKHHSDEE